MLVRPLQTIALALVAVAACSTRDRESSSGATSGGRPGMDSAMTTYEMSQALTRDVHDADRQLAVLEDSIYVFMGDSVAVLMKQARTSWEAYRKLECDAIRVAFSGGTLAPIAQMECWIDLTDDHRRFLAERYDYLRNGAVDSTRRRR
jgi:uncharacterized protein YecT (DUF1311 family)